MSDNYTQLRDTISASEGRAYITIDGQNRELFEVSKLSAQFDMTIQSRRLLNHRMTQHKAIGAEGTGSMTMYFMNSDMLKMAVQYIRRGTYGGISIQVHNEDEQSTIGEQDVVLLNVLPKTIPITLLDDSSTDPITFDTDFTFDDINPLKYFGLPENYR